MDKLTEAFDKIDRGYFLQEKDIPSKGVDAPLSIGFGQTNSQPSTVHRMLKWLEPVEGDKVLDVGTGSGWTTALLAFLVGASGKVYAVERIPELVEFGKENCDKAGIENAFFYQAGPIYGLPNYAPYDRILVSAEADKIPRELLDQLKADGRMVIPVNSSILVIDKLDDENYEFRRHTGYVFVPLVK